MLPGGIATVLFGQNLPRGACVTEYGGGLECNVEKEARECLANHWGKEGADLYEDYRSHLKRIAASDSFGGMHDSAPLFNGKPDRPGRKYALDYFLRHHEYVSTSISAFV